MKVRSALIYAVATLLAGTPAWAAHGGGGSHGGGRHAGPPQIASHVTPHAHAGSARTNSMSSTHPRPQRQDRHRGFGHQNFLGNGVVVYPWWLYDDYNNTPVTSSYYNNPTNSDVSPNPGDTALPDTSAAPDPNAARSEMEGVYTQAKAALESSPKWVAATAELKTAMVDSQAATDQMKESLLNRPDYRAAVELKRASQELASSLHQQAGATEDQIMAAARQDLEASQTIARIERETMAANATLVEARAHIQNAAAEKQALQDGLRAQVMSDPTWQAARQELTSIR